MKFEPFTMTYLHFHLLNMKIYLNVFLCRALYLNYDPKFYAVCHILQYLLVFFYKLFPPV